MAETAKFRPTYNPEVLPRATPSYGDVIPEARTSFRVANPEVLPPRSTGTGYNVAGTALERESALAGEKVAGRLGFRAAVKSGAGALGRGLGMALSAPVQVPTTLIGGTALAANAEAQRLGLGEGGDYASFSDASMGRSQQINPTGVVDVRNIAPEKIQTGWAVSTEIPAVTNLQSFRPVTPPQPSGVVIPYRDPSVPVPITPAVSPDFVPAPVTRGPDTNGFGSMRISGSPVAAGPERIADTRLGMRGYTVPNLDAAGSFLPAETGDFQVNAGLDMSRRGAYGATEGTGGTVNVVESPEQALAFRNRERVAAGLKAIDATGHEIDPTIEAGKMAAVDLAKAQAGKFRAEAEAEPVKVEAALAKALADAKEATSKFGVNLEASFEEVPLDPANPLLGTTKTISGFTSKNGSNPVFIPLAAMQAYRAARAAATTAEEVKAVESKFRNYYQL